MSGFFKVVDNKGSELNSENVADRLRPIAKYQMTYKDLYTSQFHTGLAKPGQVKRIQPKTDTCKKPPNFIPRQQSCYICIVRALTFIPSKFLSFNNCLRPVNGKIYTHPKIRLGLLLKFDLTDNLGSSFAA